MDEKSSHVSHERDLRIEPNARQASGSSTISRKTNRWSTRQLVTMALICALGVVVSFIEIPIFPAFPFLKLDISSVAALLSGLAYGCGAGIVVGAVGAFIHGIFMADLPGMFMNILAVTAFVLPVVLIFGPQEEGKRSAARIIVGLFVGSFFSIALALLANLVIDPLYMGVPFDAVVALLIPVLLPFNLIKCTLVSIVTFLLYKPFLRIGTRNRPGASVAAEQ